MTTNDTNDTNDTNGYLPYDDDTFEKNLGYHDGYTERERERMEELVNENKEAFDAAIKQADDGQVTIAVRRQRDERLLDEERDDIILLENEDDEYDFYDEYDLDDIYFDATPEPPKPNMTVWGSPERQTQLKVEITGIGNGFTATAAIYIDNGDDTGNGAILYAATVANSDCDVEHALNELAPNAVSITGAWLKANEEAGA